MKMNLDDPKLTAFTLGELSGEEFSAMEEQVAQSPDAQTYVRETQVLARQLRNEFRAELEEAHPINILPLPGTESFWSDSRWWSIGLAAALGAGALIGAVVLLGQRSQPPLTANTKVRNDVVTEVIDPSFEFVSESASGHENEFISVAAQRVSTFSLRVGDTSYENIRRALVSNRRPPKEAVRLEEMINHFSYEFPPRLPNESFSFALDLATCPWRPEHRLARVGLKATKAMAEARVEVEFNSTRVLAYRLLGYEERGGQGRTDQPANSAITALYEIVPATAGMDSIWLTARVQHEGRQSEHSLGGEPQDFAQAPADFRFAAAVAEFGMILRDSPHKGNAALETVLVRADSARGRDETGERADFVELVRKAQTLAF